MPITFEETAFRWLRQGHRRAAHPNKRRYITYSKRSPFVVQNLWIDCSTFERSAIARGDFIQVVGFLKEFIEDQKYAHLFVGCKLNDFIRFYPQGKIPSLSCVLMLSLSCAVL